MKVQPTLQRIVETLDSIKKKQDRDSTRLAKMASDVGGLKTGMGSLKQEIQSIKKTVGEVQKEQKEDSVRITILQVDMSELREVNERTEKKVDKVLEQVDNLVIGKIKTYDAEHAAHYAASARHEERIVALENKK